MAGYRTVPLNAVVVMEQFRQDLGDIDGLAASIKALGLLQPLAVDASNVLIAWPATVGGGAAVRRCG